jgi:HAE1 family hydrophobic/amphiphilic exporter-1
VKALSAEPTLQDVTSDLEVTSPQINIDIDRDKAAALGVNANTIESAFYDAYGTKWVSTIYGAANEYKVLLELEPQFQRDPAALSLLYFKATPTSAVPGSTSSASSTAPTTTSTSDVSAASPETSAPPSPLGGETTMAAATGGGPVVPLETLARATEAVGPQAINHYGQLPSVTVSFGLAPGVALGTALAKVSDVASRVLPFGVNGHFQGAALAFEGSVGNLAVLMLIAILVVYIVLGILYESYIHPLTILSGLPSAGFGALITLLLFHIDLSIYAFVGMIMLIGIVKKNAIMQIDFALEAERSGMSPGDAIYKGCLIRFRPIMMTTMAALFGAVPIAMGYGAGGEARQPLGLVVVGGLIFSQLVTLYLTPVVYTYMAQFQTWLRPQKVSTLEPVTAGK